MIPRRESSEEVYARLCADDGTAGPAQTEETLSRSGYKGVRLSDVEKESVEWLWPGRVPLGKMTVLDGDPGLGKSSIAYDLAARVSTGAAMPDGAQGDLSGPVGVVILSAEDGLADVIRPRLEAASADLGRCVALPEVGPRDAKRSPSVPEDLCYVEELAMREGARLIILDPLMALLSPHVNSHRDQDVRRALAPLARLAERTGASVLIVRHLNKAAGSSPLYRGGGSIGIVGAARSGLLVARDPDDPIGELRVLACTKANYSRLAPSLGYRIVEAGDGRTRVDWIGVSPHSADALLAAPGGAARGDGPALAKARAFLRGILADGLLPAIEVQRLAGEADISPKTLRRAKEREGIGHRRVGGGEGSYVEWYLPTPAAVLAHTCPTREVGQVCGVRAQTPIHAHTCPYPQELGKYGPAEPQKGCAAPRQEEGEVEV